MSQSLTNQNLQAVLERETLADFINMEEYVELDKDMGIFNCQNGYRGYAFEIYPPAVLNFSIDTELRAAFSQLLPIDAVMQVLMYPSRNIQDIVDCYQRGHQSPDNVNVPENVTHLINSRAEWIMKGVNTSLVDIKAFNIRPRNYRVIVTFMIPEFSKDVELEDRHVLEYAIKSQNRLLKFGARALNGDEVLTVMNELMRPNDKDASTWDTKVDPSTTLNNQIASSSDTIEYDNNPNDFLEFTNKRKEKYFASVLTTKCFPSHMTIDTPQNLFLDLFGDDPKNHFTSPYMISLTISFEDKDRTKEKETEKAQANMYQLDMVGRISKFLPKLKRRAQESEELLQALANNEMVLKSQYTVTMFAPTESILIANTEALISNAEKIGWHFQQETGIAFQIYLYSLLMQYDVTYKKWSKKYKTTLRSNNAVIAPLYHDFHGFGTPDRGMPLFGRQGQIQFFNNFDKGQAGNNAVVAAGTRSGKTFFISDLVSNSIACGRKTVIIELQETLSGLTESFGGKYIRFDENKKTCLNFFSDIKTSDNGKMVHNDAMITIIPLIGLMMNQKLIASSDEMPDKDASVLSAFIEKAVNAAFSDRRHTTGMENVYDELKKIADLLKDNQDSDRRLNDAIISLEPYSRPNGTFYEYFNGRKTEHFGDNNLVVLGLAGLQDKGPLFSIVLMALTQSVTNEFFYAKNAHYEKYLIVDEAWSILDNPIFASFVVKIWRTLNKFNGAGISISQDINQYFGSPELEALFNNSTYKIYFKQKKDEVKRLVTSEKLPSNELFLQHLMSLRTVPGHYSEMMIYTDEGYTISRVIANKYAFNIYTNIDNGAAVFELMDKLNCSKHVASWILAFLHDHKTNLNISVEAYQHSIGKIEHDSMSSELAQLLVQKS